MPFLRIFPLHAVIVRHAASMLLKRFKNTEPSKGAGWQLNEFSDVTPGVEVVMIRCLDIHTHHPAPQPLGVVSCSMSDYSYFENQLFSVGIHPWDSIKEPSPKEWEEFESLASLPCICAIGECGIDKLKGGPLFRQMIIFKRQIDLSEKLQKPLIIHDVKAHDIIVGLRRDLQPSQNWLVHGFRGKPTVAKMLTDCGIYLSFGEKFNPEALLSTPSSLILAETDESPLDILEIIFGISSVLGFDATELIAGNTSNFLSIDNEIFTDI